VCYYRENLESESRQPEWSLAIYVYPNVSEKITLLGQALATVVRGSNSAGDKVVCTHPHRRWGPPDLL